MALAWKSFFTDWFNAKVDWLYPGDIGITYGTHARRADFHSE